MPAALWVITGNDFPITAFTERERADETLACYREAEAAQRLRLRPRHGHVPIHYSLVEVPLNPGVPIDVRP